MKNTKKTFLLLGLVAVLTTIISIFLMLRDGDKSPPEINPEFSNYISAFTSGVISSESTVRIRLAEPYSEEIDYNEPIDMDLFSFSPGVEGEAYWVDEHTIEFRPFDLLPSGEIIDVSFQLHKLVKGLKDELEVFEFQFQVIQQSFEVNFEGIKPYKKKDLKRQMVYGTVVTSDVIGSERIEKVLIAKQNQQDLKITWSHDADRIYHEFTVEEVQRTENPSEVLLVWDGDPIGIDLKGVDTVEVPALGDFKVIQTTVIQQPDQYVSIMFSDPLLENQNLNGLINLSTGTTLKFTIDGNEVRAYPAARQSGNINLDVSRGVRNILNYKLKENFNIDLIFENIKPAIEFIGNGVILPGTENGLQLPFKAVNLHAVRVKIVKIYEDNVAQFLQINDIGGSREIKRVGRIVHKEKVRLTSDRPIDYGRWNNFSLDLSDMIKTDPGAIYKVYLSFKKSESRYPCGDSEEGVDNMEELDDDDNWEEDESDNQSYWGSYEDYYYYNDYNWQERDNPCHNSYYHGRRTSISKSILASDLGIIAKRGTNKSMLFAVTDLRTTKPVSGVELEVLNFQQQVIEKVTTDDKGMAKVDVRKMPYLLVAKKGEQRGYLKLDNGSSLSLSKFDVAGQVVQKGLKGFIYGERGVWRPGDSLYLSFILEDKEKLLPKSHPVSFELINPSGQTVENRILTSGLNGFYSFSTKTQDNAPTGNWLAKIKVGGATFSKTIKIETIKPNRLKINLDFGLDRLTVEDGQVEGDLEVKWLHGAIARNLKSTIYATLSAIPTTFDRFKDYKFDDPTRKFNSEEVSVFDGRVDQEGKATIKTNLSVGDAAPGMLKAAFDVKVFEESGDFSIDRFSIPYAPYETFVGIKVPKGDRSRGMLLTDKDHEVKVVTVDANGNPVQREQIRVLLYKVKWRWWWQSSYDNSLSRFSGNTSYQTLIDKMISTDENGEASFNIKVEYPDWGRYLVKAYDLGSGHSTGQTVYIDWPGWAGRAQKDNPGGASMLTFALNKDGYKVGESATVTFPSAGHGRALVSIESGSKIIQADWVEAQDKETHYTFKVNKEMAPNAYVNITLVQPHNQTRNDLPIRLYGVMPLKVEDPETHIEPIISMPDELAPETPVEIKVSEKNGKKMTYTIAMVDEGLLDLTRFKTPDPWNSFYAREALGVKTWDVYDEVLGAFNGKFAALLSLGGDGELLGAKGGKKANRFKPMVKFFGPFELEAGGTKATKFTMPKYIGSVRTMVIAGQNGAYGAAEKTTPVKKPLMVLATLPRVLGPGETVKLPVTVFAMDKKVKNVNVKVESNDLLINQGDKSRQMTFSEEGDQTIGFDLKVAEKLGIAKIKVIATSGTEKAEYEIELDVRNPNPRIVNVYDTILEAGASINLKYDVPGMNGTNEAILEISNIPPINLGRRLKYLMRYPHGCIEQTTSSVFPQLHLTKLLDDDRLKKRTSENIKAGINRIKSFQTSEGGFSYWPGHTDPNDWGSSYAGHFLLEAEKAGYNIPSGMIRLWKKYQKKQANSWRQSYDKYGYRRWDFIQAYRLYTLALAGSPQLGAMNRLKETSNLTNAAKWRLAAAYQLAGKPEIAKELAKDATTEINEDYRELSYTYGSSDRDRAMILEALVLMGRRSDGMHLVKLLSRRLSAHHWMSTQTTAYSLLAIAKYVGADNTNQTMKYSFVNEGEETNVNTKAPLSNFDISVKKNNQVKISNKGSGVIFARVISSGIPVAGNETSSSNDLNMSVVYKDLSGNTIDPSRLEQGMDFKAEVTIHNPGLRGAYKEMALSQIFPSGWEIRNLRLSDMGSVHYKSTPTYQDIRDDRVYTYFDLYERKSKTFVVLLNATYEGKFYLPGINCEAMYDNTINARESGRWIEVYKP